MRTPDRIVWWARAQSRVMFFGGQENVQRPYGHLYPHPPLVFKVRGRELLSGRSLKTRAQEQRHRSRPHPTGTLIQGKRMCGTMRFLASSAANSISAWEEAYFGSELLIPPGRSPHQHRRGFVGLWKSLKDKNRQHLPDRHADGMQRKHFLTIRIPQGVQTMDGNTIHAALAATAGAGGRRRVVAGW